jgi:hypothetical protein
VAWGEAPGTWALAGVVALYLTGFESLARAQVAPPAPESIAVGDWQLTPVVEARMRGEYWHDLDGVDRGVLIERARLGVHAIDGALEGRVVLQDARLWDLGEGGDTAGGPQSLATTGMQEAWGEAHTSGMRSSFVRVGRQPVRWGEGRLLGVADWSPTGRTLDALRARWVVGDGDFEVLGASLSDPAIQTLNAYGELFGGRAQWALDPLFALEAYVLARIAQASPAQTLEGSVPGQTYTMALRLHGDSRGWTWGVEGAYQLGHVDRTPTFVAAERAAWAAAGHLAYAFPHVALLPTARLGAAYASGDHGGPTYRAFDPLLPEVHTWHGAMDLFAWSNEAEGSVRVTVTPWTDATATVEYRYARLADPAGAWRTGYLVTLGRDPLNTKYDLGHEFDGGLSWTPWLPVELSAGYSALVLGEGARAILTANRPPTGAPGASAPTLAHFAFAQATLRLP